MKQILLLAGALAVSYGGIAQCDLHIFPANPTLCPGNPVDLTAVATGPNSLTTTMAAGNSHRGNMFDIVATNTVVINSFEAHPAGNTTIEVYYKSGPYAGFETNASAWTLVGTATNVVANLPGTPTLIPLNVDITISAGQTASFYVTSTDLAVSLNYSNGTSTGAVYASDANIQFLEGVGLEYPFGGGIGLFSPRIWNGVIHYYLPGTKDYLWSTGATSGEISVSPASQTTYITQLTMSGCSLPLIDSVTVNIADSALSLGPDTSICQGESITFDAGNTGASYVWNDMSTGQTLTASTAGTYYVDVTVPAGCVITDSIDLAINVPNVDLGPDTSVCQYDLIVLNGGPGSDYLWNTGDTTQYLTIDAGTWSPGLHFLNLTALDANGCLDTDYLNLMIEAAPNTNLGNDTTICVNHTLILDAGTADTYTWSTGSTSQTITIDGSVVGTGSFPYNVYAVGANGCDVSDSIVVTIDPCTGIGETNGLLFEAYPNPGNGLYTLSFDGFVAGSVSVYDHTGRLIGSNNVNAGSFTLDLTDKENGMYLIVVNVNDHIGTMRLIKH